MKIEDAYQRVWGVEVTKSSIRFGVGLHADSDAPMISNSHFVCDYNIDGENLIRQAYEYLKKQPEYSDAVDV